MIKQIFVWWHKQTFGTFLKTFFFGKLVGKDKFGNKYYKNKKNDRWIVYSGEIDASKIPVNWFHWVHHTTNEVPTNEKKKYPWEKEHQHNLTGSVKAYKPSKITKKTIKKYKTWHD